MPFPTRFGKPTNKFGAKKIELDGHKFDSKFEATVYEFLRDQHNVKILELHPKYLLQPAYETKDGRKVKKIEYWADFFIDVDGDRYIIDAKGQETKEFAIKRKLFEFRYPDDILVVAHSMKELRLAIL